MIHGERPSFASKNPSSLYQRLYDYARARLNLDVELRYRAVARWLRPELVKGSRILEVGAGAISVGTYLGCCSTAVDATFDSDAEKYTARVQASADDLPFLDKSWDIVVSIDMLEHIPPNRRDKVLREMIRVSRKLLLLAVPIGQAAYDHDVKFHNYYIVKHGQPHRFAREHVQFGLPSLSETCTSLERAAESTGRLLHLDTRPNVNIGFRSWYMKLGFHSSIVARALYVAMFPLVLFGPVYDRGTCYRTILLARLEERNAVVASQRTN